MTVEFALVWLVAGACAGLFAGMTVRGGGFGLVRDAGIGMTGALAMGSLLNVLGLAVGISLVSDIAVATLGALILLAFMTMVPTARSA